MSKILLVFTGCVLPLLFTNCYVNCDKLKIHNNLVQCYRGNNTAPWFGNTLEILLELIRKIEDANPTSLDIRTLSVQIVHRLRIDGIQKAPNGRETATMTPYSPSGLMVPKFELLLKLISDSPSNFNFEDSLTPTELCLFHRLVSTSVEPRIRGDEPITCTLGDDKGEFANYWIPTQKVLNLGSGKLFILSEQYSKCPVENGVIYTSNYGSFSPGIVIASIAAALQPQSVQLRELLPPSPIEHGHDYSSLETMQKRHLSEKQKLFASVKSIDNVFAANLAGDLAEACVNQVPYTGTNITIGVNGFWNSEVHPTVRYITDNIYLNWAMTDSEILGGLDGLHLANKIYSWTKKVARMKLSQVLEMYYTSRGIPTYAIENENEKKPPYNSDDDYQPTLGGIRRHRSVSGTTRMRMGYEEHFENELYVDKACERKFVLARINKAKLREQTYSVAQVLQYMDVSVTLNDTLLKSACYAAVDKFYERANTLVGSLPTCEFISGNYRKPYVDLILIIDESRDKEENLALIWYLSELIDVSSFGSYISVIHGTSGRYLVRRTNSIARAFEELRNYTGPYPSRLSLSESLSSIIFAAEEQKNNNNESGKIVGPPQVVLVVSQGQKIGQNDFDDSRRLLAGSFQQFPNMNFLFLTDDGDTFKDLVQNVLQMPHNPSEKYQILQTSNKHPTTFSNEISRLLNSIPKWLSIPRDEQSSEGTSPIQHEYEDYLSPNIPIFYKIHEKELEGRGDFAVQFIGVGYGDFTVCKLNDNKNLQCQSTTVQDPVWFNITNTCDLTKSNTCSPIIFRLEMDSSNMKCSESDCRYPDQVRFMIRPTKWSRNSSTKKSLSNVLLSSLILIFSVKLMNS